MNKYQDFYKKNCLSIDARTFPNIRDQILVFLKDENCPEETKIMFGDWFFRKIYMLYKPMTPIKKDICQNVQSAISTYKPIVLKSEYLKFHDVIAMSYIASYFYDNRFQDKDEYFVLQMLNDTQLIKNYLQLPEMEAVVMKKHFIEWINRQDLTEEQRSNLLDVLLTYFPQDKDVEKIHKNMSGGDSIQNDRQNVHDKDVQKSTLSAAKNLMEWYDEKIKEETKDGKLVDVTPAIERAENTMKLWYPSGHPREIALGIIQRSKIDTTPFTYEDKTFTICDILIATVDYISQSECLEIIQEILLEEMTKMLDLCSSGYIARFISVLQGFDDRFLTTISAEKNMKMGLSYKLSKAMEKASENVMNGMMDEEYKEFYVDFVNRLINDGMNELFQRYEEEDILKFYPGVVTQTTTLNCEMKKNGNSYRCVVS
jgi:hypothetical protein